LWETQEILAERQILKSGLKNYGANRIEVVQVRMRSQYFVDTSVKGGEFHDQLNDYQFLKKTLLHGFNHCNIEIMVFCDSSPLNLIDK
jgi:hypothetical protein